MSSRPTPPARRRAIATVFASLAAAALALTSVVPAAAAGEEIVVEGGYGGLVSNPVPVSGYINGWQSGMTFAATITAGTYGAVTTSIPCDITGTTPARFSCDPWSGLPAGAYTIWLRLMGVESTGDVSAAAVLAEVSVVGKLASSSVLPSRIQGADRYATAAAIAGVWGNMFGEHDTATSLSTDERIAFVATGENYPDALSAAAAASYMDASLVLVKKYELPAVVKSRLNALRPTRIYVLGTSASIANSVVTQLRTVTGAPTVSRIAGDDRYATMRDIVKLAFNVDGNGNGAEDVKVGSVVIATGKNFPDALSAAAAVAKKNGAVILVDGSQTTIPSATLNLIKDLEPHEIVIAGGTPSVKSGIESQLKNVFGSGKVSRKAGADRYATSVMITDHYFGAAPAVFFAVGTKFPDALAGATLAGALKSPLLVTEKSCVLPSAKTLIQNQLGAGAERVLLGSSASISSSVASLKTC